MDAKTFAPINKVSIFFFYISITQKTRLSHWVSAVLTDKYQNRCLTAVSFQR